MRLLGWIVLCTAFGGVVSAAFAGLLLLVPERAVLRMLPHFVSFATGALLGAALLALLPEAIETVGPGGAHGIGVALVAGLGVFFLIEKLVLWKHAHSHDGEPENGHHAHQGNHAHDADHSALRGSRAHEVHPSTHHGNQANDAQHHASRAGAAGVLVLVGDSVHNALDGILIAAAFLTDVPLGLVTTFAVAAHEVPHRVGDFAILVHAGLSRGRALVLNMATGLGSVLGGIVAYFGLQGAMGALPYALAVAAAGFLYIAVAGLIPGLHRRADPRTSLAQMVLIGLGVAVIAGAQALAP